MNSRARRDRYWPEIERYLGALPTHLYQQGALLKNDLAILYSDTGQLEDILRRPHDHPLLEQHNWVLDDWGVPEDPERERRLFLAAAFSFAAMYAHESILYRRTVRDNRLLLLEHALTRQATLHLAAVVPEASRLWDHAETVWGDYAEAILWELREHAGRVAPFAAADLPRLAAKWAPARISVTAAALDAGQEARLPQLFALLDHLDLVVQVRRDVAAFRQDLHRGNFTYPIVQTMMAAGIELRPPATPERVLGAALLTGSVARICRECLPHLEAGQDLARALRLPTFAAYLAALEQATEEMLSRFSLKARARATTQRPAPAPRPASAPSMDPLSKAVMMAEGYLKADLTFRESWEVQRGGMFNLPELTARAFPSGLVVEVLCANGHPMPSQVGDIFETLHGNGFRYFDGPHNVLPDADNLGLLLRLCEFSPIPARHREMLRTPLRWMAANILPSGEIPVWFTQDLPADEELLPILLFGNSCATVEANLLLGLIRYAWDGYRAIVEASASSWLARWRARGLGATVHYVPLYSLWVAVELIDAMTAQPLSDPLRASCADVSVLVLDRLAREAGRRTLTPQDAALATLACLRPAARHLFNPEWITTLVDRQRYDGGWADEPLYLCANQEGTSTWYASRLATTALCYHALEAYRRAETHEEVRWTPSLCTA